jgi:hypothetical protein
MNWSALTKKQKHMAVVTVVLAVVQVFLLAHFLGWTKPSSARGGSAKEELLDLDQKIEDARGFLKREKTIASELEKTIQALDKLTVHAPTISDRYAWAYEYVSRCAAQSRIELDSLEEVLYLSTKKNAVSEPYEISISSQCGYNNLVEFLWRIETGNPLLRIREIKISAVPDTPQFHRVNVKMQWPASIRIEGKEEKQR